MRTNAKDDLKVNKDQSYGGLIFVISVLVFIGYIVALTNSAWRPWVLGAPVVLAVLGVLGITGWIGWTMLTAKRDIGNKLNQRLVLLEDRREALASLRSSPVTVSKSSELHHP